MTNGTMNKKGYIKPLLMMRRTGVSSTYKLKRECKLKNETLIQTLQTDRQ